MGCRAAGKVTASRLEVDERHGCFPLLEHEQLHWACDGVPAGCVCRKSDAGANASSEDQRVALSLV